MKKTQLKDASVAGVIHLKLFSGLIHGLMRTIDARLGLALAESYFTAHASDLPKEFNREAYEYVVTASLLVYCVSIFDVFLSDVTRALLLNDIGTLGKNCLVPIEVLASQKARNEIIRKEVEKRVRNVAYKSFEERLAMLSGTFGIDLNLEQKDTIELRRLSDLRNRLVHDQSSYLFRLDRRHRPSIRAKKNLHKPIAVTERDIDSASTLFETIGKQTVQKIEIKLLGHTHLK